MGYKRYFSKAIKERLSNLQLALQFFWNCSPKTAGLTLVFVVLEGLFPLLLVNITRHVVNQFSSFNDLFNWATGPGLWLLFALIGREALNLFGNLVKTFHEERVSDYVNTRAQQIASSADMVQFESSTFYDHLYRAGFESDQHVIDVVDHLADLASGFITMMGLLIIVSQYSWWLPVVFLAASIPVFLTLLIQSQKRYQWNKSMTYVQRKSRYLNWLLVGQEAAGEIRIYGLGKLFLKKYRELREKVLSTRLALEQSQILWVSGANMLSLILLAAGILFILRQFEAGLADTGAIALMGHATLLCRQSAQTLLRETANLYRASLFLADLDYIIKLKPLITAPDNPKDLSSLPNHEIKLSNVDFTYPEMDSPALKNLSLSIPSNKITVILGKNGSGKSTLGKLICRFFDPDKGKIQLGNCQLKAFDPVQLRSQLGYLFQDPVRYYFSAEENVIFGNTNSSQKEPLFKNAIDASLASSIIDELPEGKKTQLGRWFQEGTELSGGQWQRLALARTHFSDRPIWVLDEPTSSMDPWTEQVWLENVKRDAVDKTIILITHRICSANIADHLIVMDAGQAIESGTPPVLMQSNGVFAKLWKESASQLSKEGNSL